MKDYIDSFINYIEKEKGYSKNTIINYKLDLELFYSFLAEKKVLDVNLIDYKLLRNYLSYLHELKYESKTVARMLSTLKSFYKYLIRKKMITKNPMNLIKIPKTEKKLPKFLYYDELETLLNIPKLDNPLGIRDSLILEMLYSTGIRVSEIVNVKLNDINYYDRRIIINGKGNKERYVLFGTKMYNSLILYIDKSRSKLVKIEHDYLLVNKNGTKLTDRGIRKIMENVLKKGNINNHISPHTIRHTFATHMLDSGADIKTVQELLGHSSLSTTQIYTHVSNEKLKDVYYKTHPRANKKD